MKMNESYFEKRNNAFEEMNGILDDNGDDPDDPKYREAFERWRKIATGGC